MLGSGINPESFKQDYSGFSRAAEIQAQGLQNLGQSIGGAIQNYGEAKKEQRKVDAYNKASAKSIEAAITLGDFYRIKGARETLSPFLSAANDPNLSPIEKAALLDEAKAMIPNVFGRFDKSEAIRIEQAAMNARGSGGDRAVNLQQGEVIETINGKQYKVPVTFDPVTGERRRPDGTIVGAPMSAGGASPAAGISSALNLPARPVAGGLQSQANAINNAALLPSSGIYTDDTSQLPPLNTGVANEGSVLLPVEGTQPDLSTPTAPALGNAPATPVDTTTPEATPVPSYAIPLEEDKVETKALTKEQVAAAGFPAGEYIGRFKNGELTSVQPIPPRPDEIGGARQKALDAPNIAYIEKANASAQKLASLTAAFDLLNSKAVESGTFANYKTDVKRLFGVDVANEEQFNSLVGNLAMEALDLTKGAISNMEQKYFTEVLAPNITKSVGGNKAILEFRIGLAKRDVEIGKKVSEMFEKNASPLEIQKEVTKIIEKNPLNKSAASQAPAPAVGLDQKAKDDLEFLGIPPTE